MSSDYDKWLMDSSQNDEGSLTATVGTRADIRYLGGGKPIDPVQDGNQLLQYVPREADLLHKFGGKLFFDKESQAIKADLRYSSEVRTEWSDAFCDITDHLYYRSEKTSFEEEGIGGLVHDEYLHAVRNEKTDELTLGIGDFKIVESKIFRVDQKVDIYADGEDVRQLNHLLVVDIWELQSDYDEIRGYAKFAARWRWP